MTEELVGKKSQTSITIDSDLLEKIRDDADQENRSVSNFIENAVLEWYELKMRRP